jgi:hypothetical protein
MPPGIYEPQHTGSGRRARAFCHAAVLPLDIAVFAQRDSALRRRTELRRVRRLRRRARCARRASTDGSSGAAVEEERSSTRAPAKMRSPSDEAAAARATCRGRALPDDALPPEFGLHPYTLAIRRAARDARRNVCDRDAVECASCQEHAHAIAAAKWFPQT